MLITGVPTAVVSQRTDIQLPMDQKICDVLKDGDHVDVETSLGLLLALDFVFTLLTLCACNW